MGKPAIFVTMFFCFFCSAVCWYSFLNQNQFVLLGGGIAFLSLGVVELLLFFFEKPVSQKEAKK